MTEYGTSTRAKVSVIGLGAMGSTLARTLAAGGCEVTVWNRSSGRAAPLASAGCRVATSAASAIAASPVTVLCVLNEDAVDAVLGLDGVGEALAGRVLANLSTIPAENVKRHADFVRRSGGVHLSGGILCYPRSIGRPDGVIVYSGDRGAFRHHSDTLAILAGGQQFVGDGDGNASVVYTACWVYYYGGLGGFFEAAAYAASCGVDIAEFDDLIPSVSRELLGGVKDAVRRIRAGDYSGEQGPVDGHIDGVGTFATTMRSAGVDADICESFVAHCRRAASAGYGGEDIAAMFKTIKRA